jgi:hypothetical protein
MGEDGAANIAAILAGGGMAAAVARSSTGAGAGQGGSGRGGLGMGTAVRQTPDVISMASSGDYQSGISGMFSKLMAKVTPRARAKPRVSKVEASLVG